MVNKESKDGMVATVAILAFLAGAGLTFVADRLTQPNYFNMMGYPRICMTAPMGFHMGEFNYRTLPSRMPMMGYWGK